MNEIERTQDYANSELLAKWTGWRIVGEGCSNKNIVSVFDGEQFLMYLSGHNNLYHTRNMAAAWEVLNRASSKFGHLLLPFKNEYWIDLWDLPAAEAQRAWLDRIVELIKETET